MKCFCSIYCYCHSYCQFAWFSWSSNRIIPWYQVTSRHLRYPSPFLYFLLFPVNKLFVMTEYFPSSPAFFRYRWNLLLTVPRAPMTIVTSTTSSCCSADALALVLSLGILRFLVDSGRMFGLVYSPWEWVTTSHHGSQVSLFLVLVRTVLSLVSLLSPTMLSSG